MHRHGHPVTVLERDPAPDARPQGGTLDMHAGMGQVALAKAGLLEEFHALSRREGQAMRILGEDGAVLRDWPAGPDDDRQPEIDRGLLRDLLLGPLDVRWGRGVAEVVPSARDGALVRFADGSEEPYDLVVGADGAWSRVRPAVSAAIPHYTGVTVVETTLDDVDERHPDLARLVGDGSMSAYGADRVLTAQRNSGGRVMVYAQLRGPVDWHTGVDPADPEAVRSCLLAMFHGWDDGLLELLRRGRAYVNRPIHTLPAAHTWTHTPGVTLLGDAAHLMPPLGVGANLAMLEGAELAEAILARPGLDEVVRAYEELMWPRAARWAEFAIAGLRRLVSGAAEAVALFDEFQPSA
ncbi:monooxygenase [Planobispora takensis]|uniref:Monooxygenase n=2 Tax=Planobispora takensis TaxID=1367882 RepID=A0A8J3WSK6_9ACTN|nr:monooxygenase [Planobispora takensis]